MDPTLTQFKKHSGQIPILADGYKEIPKSILSALLCYLESYLMLLEGKVEHSILEFYVLEKHKQTIMRNFTVQSWVSIEIRNNFIMS